MALTHFCRNGTILPVEEAVIPLQNIEYSYGFGVYETIVVADGKPRFAKEHIERLFRSATLIGIDHAFIEESIVQWLHDLTEKHADERYNLKILLIGAKEASEACLHILPLNPLFPEKRLYKEGVDTMTVEYERPIPNAKTLNMLRSYLAQKKAKEAGCHEGLSLHQDECIYEGTRSNFFVVQNDTILTPPEGSILLGITREHVLELAKKNGIQVQESVIPLNKIAEYDGAFLTSSSMKVMPIRRINDVELDIPDTTKKLIELYKDFLDKNQY